MSENSKALTPEAIKYAAIEAKVSPEQALTVLKLMIEDDSTIPFIARYRKEKTGGLDEVQIEAIREQYDQYIEREKRREFILETIEKQGQLTDKLKKDILAATTLNQLEDLYAPYKSKKKTKGQLAVEAGLGPLAENILNDLKESDLEVTLAKYLNPEKEIKTAEDALEGAKNIIIERIAHAPEIKEQLRTDYWKDAVLKAEKRKKAEEQKDWDKYRDYFEFEQKISQLQDDKTAHRVLAIRRGMTQKILKVDVVYDVEQANATIISKFFDNKRPPLFESILEGCVHKAYQLSIHPSLDLEIKSALKTSSDKSAIDVFGVNLKNLLLQPYLGPKTVLGVDPGIRTGCKVVVVKDSGELILDTVIYLSSGETKLKQSAQIIEAIIEQFKVQYIAVGNGTFGRETLQFLKENISAVSKKKVHATMINEAGASIYSTSEVARKEFPDKDPTVRGAVSIARRFQDPLAELVKIDPKSIGVGQYQHDVNQAKLKKTLGQIVENCVNFVGVDLNTASAPLLSYVSGIGPTLAQNIVGHRHKKGSFKKRSELLKVARFSDKVFEQSAGFLRIYNGENPLDQTFIHPERYEILEAWAKKQSHKLEDLIENSDLIKKLEQDTQLKEQIGEYTHSDIVKSLKAPRQDPRTEFAGAEFRDDINSIKDLKEGEWYPGVVTNITQFGAFIDIGIKENGLLHVSQMADHFVSNALDEVKVGESLKVKIIEIDHERGRISLSCKTDAEVTRSTHNKNSNAEAKTRGKGRDQGRPGQRPQDAPLKNNPFSVLQGMKIK